MKKIIKKVIRKIFRLLNALFQSFRHPYGEILALHRVVAKRSLLEDNRSLEITPAFLEQTILKYKSAGYCLFSIDEVQQLVESRKRGKGKFICFTLDDGYADNLEQAYPVFKKYNCPFTIYVTTDFPDQKAKLWWYDLQDILLAREKLQLNGIEYDCSDLKKKNEAFRKIREKVFSIDAEKTLNEIDELYKEIDSDARHDVKMLSWEQITVLSEDPLCTIGAHTVSHASLPALSNEKIRKELAEGKKKIEEKIKKPVKHFAYPFGNWDKRVASLVMEQYSTAVLASDGLVRKGASLFGLNRNELIENP